MSLRTLVTYPHVLKTFAFCLIVVLLILLWFHKDPPTTRITTWQIFPYLLIITFIYEKEDYIVTHPGWPFWEVFFSILFFSASLLNSVVIIFSTLKSNDCIAYAAATVSLFLVFLWIGNLASFATTACRRYNFVNKEPPREIEKTFPNAPIIIVEEPSDNERGNEE